jgi:CRP-like cAMP-binding protein
MPTRRARARASTDSFDIQAFLDANGVSTRAIRFARGAVVLSQGGRANSVFYLQEGAVKLSVLSSAGKESLAKGASRRNLFAWERRSPSSRPGPFASRKTT